MLCDCLLRVHRFAGSAVRLASVLPVPASSLNRKQVENKFIHVGDRACALVFLGRPASSVELACVVLRFTSSFVSRARMPLCSLASSARFPLLLLCAQVDS